MLQVAGAAATLSPLSGCALHLPIIQPEEELQDEMAIGRWLSRHDDTSTNLEFRDDGTFDWPDVPGGFFDAWTPSNNLKQDRYSCSGEWKVAKSIGSPWRRAVHMHPKVPSEAFGFELFTEGRGGTFGPNRQSMSLRQQQTIMRRAAAGQT
ncbi:hypothetical protein [Paenarthrobacter sp. NPDC058040]|uniref:hypothetical protein n=1 Tax=unclassified Paenarthrobacter TaxID=2634190 RepID=UPI0036DB6895